LESFSKSAKAETPLWRSSSLALLFHGLDRVEARGIATLGQMGLEARRIKVRLHGEDGEQFIRFRGVEDGK